MKKIWLYLEPYTFIFFDNDHGLIYNALTYESKKFFNKGKLKEKMTLLRDIKNMYCIELSDIDLEDLYLKELLEWIRNSYSGDLIEASMEKNKPLILVPCLKLLEDKKNGKGVSGMSYLSELSIYIGGKAPGSNLLHRRICNQFDFCADLEEKQIPVSSIKQLVHQIKGQSGVKMNLLGGNILSYPFFNELLEIFSEFTTTFYIHINDIPDDLQKLNFLINTLFELNVLVDFPIKLKKIENFQSYLVSSAFKSKWLFAVTSVNQFVDAQNIIDNLNIKTSEIKPVYTENNYDFFTDYIFLSEKDITETKQGRKDIFRNQTLNHNYFGKLYFMPDLKVYTNLNKDPIGGIEESLPKIVYKEMNEGKSWFEVRNFEPCCTCLYNWLCPPLSNYEFVLGKPNLCDVK